jgi:hypothetical protein
MSEEHIEKTKVIPILYIQNADYVHNTLTRMFYY